MPALIISLRLPITVDPRMLQQCDLPFLACMQSPALPRPADGSSMQVCQLTAGFAQLPNLTPCGPGLCSVAKYPGNPCLGHRPIKYGEPQPYSWLSYEEASERVAAVAGAMTALGLQAHGRVGVYGINSPEWMMAMQAGASGTPLALSHARRGSCCHHRAIILADVQFWRARGK